MYCIWHVWYIVSFVNTCLVDQNSVAITDHTSHFQKFRDDILPCVILLPKNYSSPIRTPTMPYQDRLNMQWRAFSTCPQYAAASKVWWLKGSSIPPNMEHNFMQYMCSHKITIIHSKYSHKLHVLGNVFVKLISLTERLPHHICIKTYQYPGPLPHKRNKAFYLCHGY